jgi:predicted restriction endonuclease
MDLVKEGQTSQNRFVVNDALKNAFTYHFNILKKANDADKIIQPFYQLHSDGIWHFKVKAGKQAQFESLHAKGGTPSVKSLFDVIEYAYLDEELFNYFKNDLARQTIRDALLKNLEDLSEQFYRWLIVIGKSEKTAKSYVGAIKGTISNWADESSITSQNLISIQSFSKIHGIAEQLAKYEAFQAQNTKGKGMYNAALNAYLEFLADAKQAHVAEDIEEIIQDQTIDSTQKATLVNTRVGQGKFRDQLIEYWKGCAVTKYPAVQFLVASHIKPWRASSDNERLDKFNGILLLPNLDKAFDLGYISFDENGLIKTSDFIEQPEVLGINENLKINVAKRHQGYLDYHREHVFKS